MREGLVAGAGPGGSAAAHGLGPRPLLVGEAARSGDPLSGEGVEAAPERNRSPRRQATPA